MEDNFEKSMDLVAFYHKMLVEFGLTEEGGLFIPKASSGQTVTVTLNKQQSDKLFDDLNNAENRQPPTEPKKEWEILEWGRNGYSMIKSVKRLYDGEVFTVGDEVIHKTDPKTLANTAKIVSFFVPSDIEGKMWFHFDNSFCVKDLANFNKLPAKTPLFTSEDGVPIYEDSIVWWLDITTGRIVMWNNTITQISVLGRFYVNKYFSTEAAAKDYRRVHHIWGKDKPKKVEVNVWEDFQGQNGYFYYQVNSKKEITKDKFPAIKQAIEDILNDKTQNK